MIGRALLRFVQTHRFIQQWRWIIGAGILGATLIISVVPVYAISSSHNAIYTTSTVPQRDVAIIFGAGLEAPGKPSNFLESRLLAGLKLYKTGKVKVIVVSGDNRRYGYDEPTAMRNYLIKSGVPASSIVADYAGFNTYDTCYRASAIFGLQSAILVTHGYHLPRSIMTCNARGVASIGVVADRGSFSKNYLLREVLSLNKAAAEIAVHAQPDILGRQETSVHDVLHPKTRSE